MFRLKKKNTGLEKTFMARGKEARTVSVVSVAAVRGRSVDVLDPAANGNGAVGEVLDGADGLEVRRRNQYDVDKSG